jgi:putative sterol carrier protein
MAKYATLRRLTGRAKGDVGETFAKAAELLANSADSGNIQFCILNKDDHLYWNLHLHFSGCNAHPEKALKPDLEIITNLETWRQMADGKLSPLVAFARRKMRVRGDVSLGKRILKQLASPGGKLDIC